MQVVVAVQQVDLQLGVPREVLRWREPHVGGVLGRDIYHTGVEVDVVPQLLCPGVVVCCREIGGVHEWPGCVVLQTSWVDDMSAVE